MFSRKMFGFNITQEATCIVGSIMKLGAIWVERALNLRSFTPKNR